MTFADRSARPSTTTPLRYAALLGVVLLAGCTSAGPTPPITSSTANVTGSTSAPATSSSPVATATPTTATPTPSVDPVLARIPPAARPETEAGSLAYVRYFIKQVNESFTQPDPSALEGLFSPSCTACLAFRHGASKLEAAGEKHEGLSIESTGANINEYAKNKRSVAVTVVQHSVPVVDKWGKKVRLTTAGSGVFLATVSFAGHWSVINLQIVK